ncbi:hypothetical protein ACLKMY_25950 [Paraburkholderia mimosarum]|uniref:hypothetical protein n=1 Tax=Paraburkholderia mimosarum TaxID=312026 RepID=UPI0039C142DB
MAFNPLQTRAARVTVSVTRPSGVTLSGEQTDTYVFEQHRMSIRVVQGGGRFGDAEVNIQGVPLAVMNNVARLPLVPMTIYPNDTLSIDVWDGSQFVPFFSGVIDWAESDGTQMPKTALTIHANACLAGAQTVGAPYSYQGTLDLKSILTGILKGSPFALDWAPSMPQLTVTNPRYSGSVGDQVDMCLRAFPQVTHDYNLQRLRVFPANGSFADDPILVSPATGMQRSPKYGTHATTFTTLFDPSFTPGRAIKLDSAFTTTGGANSIWVARVLNHLIEPNTLNGQWITQCAAIGILSNPDTNTQTPGS